MRHDAGRRPRASLGFTLIELVLVITIGSVIAATLAVFFRPAVEAWFDVRVRSDLASQAVSALRPMQRDVRSAVPNSIRTPDTNCFELVPTAAGGRFRTAADTSVAGSCSGATCSMPLDVTAIDPAQPTLQFDVLTSLAETPSVGDWVVIDNQNPSDVYGGTNRAALTAAPTTPAANLGVHRLTIATQAFPSGYTGSRFVVVPNAQQAVFYVCSGADGGLDASGNGKGTLVRLSRYGFNATYPSSCPATTGGAVLATNVRSCRFVYDPNQGATQQSGFVSMQLELARNGETASLLTGVHVVNVP